MTSFKPIPESEYFKNPGYLKLDLMLKGVRVDSSLYDQGVILGPYRLSSADFGNLDLVLPGDTYVSVPYQEDFSGDSPYTLCFLRGSAYLAHKNETISVKVIPHPTFYSEKVHGSISIGDISQCHGGYVSLSLGGHRYLQPHLAGGLTPEQQKDLELTVEEVIGVLERIRKDQAIDVVTLSSWISEKEDGGILQIEPYIRAIKNSFHLLLFVEVHLPQKTTLIDQTYAMGADSVCYHLGDLCSHTTKGEKATAAAPMAMDEELKLLKHAVEIFPTGTVLSHITMGDRPFSEVMEDIDQLTKIRLLPILTILNRDCIREKGWSTPELAPLFGYVYNAAKKHNIKMNWFAKLAPFIAPIEGRFFSGDTPRLKLALLNFYQSRLFGGSISASLSNLRRRLRVREVKSAKKM